MWHYIVTGLAASALITECTNTFPDTHIHPSATKIKQVTGFNVVAEWFIYTNKYRHTETQIYPNTAHGLINTRSEKERRY